MNFIRYDELENRASKLKLTVASVAATVFAVVMTIKLFNVEYLWYSLRAMIG